MTQGGQYLDSLNLFKKYPYQQAVIPWSRLSENFARDASGSVSAFVQGARPTSIFTTVEQPILLSNPNVTEILYSPEYRNSYMFRP